MRLDVTVTGASSVESKLRRFAERVTSRQAMSEIADALIDEQRKYWSRGAGWQPLDPDTVRWKARRGQPRTPLKGTGRLQRALTQRGAAGQRLDITGSQVIFGIDPNGPVGYAQYHQEGKGVPRRPVIKVTGETRRAVMNTLRDFLQVR